MGQNSSEKSSSSERMSFYIMLCLSSMFCAIEFVVGYTCHSVALVADSFHMLSDVLSLVIGLLSLKYSTKTTRKEILTYGWLRVQVIGAFSNCVFLLSLCTNIFNEAIGRLVHRERINEPKLVLFVGGIGLAINLIGFVVFEMNSGFTTIRKICPCFFKHSTAHTTTDLHCLHENDDNEEKSTKSSSDSSDDTNSQRAYIHLLHHHHGGGGCQHGIGDGQMNIKGVLLHIIGDALGSVVVIVSTTVYYFNQDSEWTLYIDPAMSLILVLIMLNSTITLFNQAKNILLLCPPKEFVKEENVDTMLNEMREKIPAIRDIQQLRIWQLNDKTTVCTVHMWFDSVQDWITNSKIIRQYFHVNNIHSVSIMPHCGRIRN